MLTKSEDELPKSRWGHFTSFLPGRRTFKKIAANLLELTGTALQIVSEITTFVAGMGFFISPPLKKVYAQLQGKNMHYTVNGTGVVCTDMNDLQNSPTLPFDITLLTMQPQGDLCNKFNNELLISSEVEFSLAYPESLFSASVVLFSLGCSGFLLAHGLKKLGASLHEWDKFMPPLEEQILKAKKWQRPLLITSNLFFLSSRVAAAYATTTISLTRTIKNIPSILEDFSISSTRKFIYHYKNPSPNPAPLQNLKSIKSDMDFITTIGFSELRAGATQGGERVEDYDYYIGLGLAGGALILGYIALKAKQQVDHYKDISDRNKHYLELQPQLKDRDDIILSLKAQIQAPQLEASTREPFPPNVGASPHGLFFTPREQETNPTLPEGLPLQETCRITISS